MSSSRPWKRSRNGTGPSGPTTSTVPSSSTIGSRRRAAAMASLSRVWAFSRTSSSSRAACQVDRSTTGGRPGSAEVESLGVVVMASSVVSPLPRDDRVSTVHHPPGGPATAPPAPYLVFDRPRWSALRAATPLTLDESDLAGIRGLGETIDLAEVEEVYLPLSR